MTKDSRNPDAQATLPPLRASESRAPSYNPLNASRIRTSASPLRDPRTHRPGWYGQGYRAHDTRLDPDVALKVLPAELSDDEFRLARFEHEARSLARLNHPNIVTIHSVEEADGTRFLTMELIESRTLDGSLDASGSSLENFLDLMIPVATALAAAHEKGVTHRDLKPSNVMVDGDHNVKILDFSSPSCRRRRAMWTTRPRPRPWGGAPD